MPRPLTYTIASLLLATAALAEDASPLITLAPVIVTATQTDETVFDTPYTANVVNSKRFLDERSARSLVDALRETPGVMIQRTGYAQASPFLRGFTGYRTLTLIDGIRLNNATFRDGPNQYFETVDLFTIDRIEVVKGPSSALYGSDAIGGAVNLITRDPQMLPWPDAKQSGEGFALHGGAYYRYATAENSHIARGEFGLALGPQLGVLGGITWKDFDDLHGGDLVGTQSKSGYGEVDGDIKVVYRIDKDTDLTAAFYRTEQDGAPRWHATKFSDKGFDRLANGTDIRRDLDQTRELAYLKYEQRDIASWLNSVRFSFSFHRQTETQDRLRDTLRRDVDGFQDDQYGLVLNLESPSPIGTLSYGVEYYHDNVESWGSRWNEDGSLRNIKPRGPFSDEGVYDQLGIYVQDRFKPVEPIEITLGVRYSWAEARGGIVDDDLTDTTTFPSIDKTFDALTGSMRFRLDVARDWNFFGGVSQGFRTPSLADLTSFDIARSGEQETPAPNLQPEHFLAFEIGTKFRSESLRLETYVAYFHTLIDNQIVRYPTGRVIDDLVEVQKANVGDGFIHGIEFGAEWNFYDGFTIFGNLTWTEGELDNYVGKHITALPASRIQPLTGLVGLRWRSEDRRWFAEATAALARRQDRLSPGDMADTQRIPPGGTKGYQVFSVRAGWEPRDWMQITAALENINDEDYRFMGSGINEAGTNFIVSTRLRF